MFHKDYVPSTLCTYIGFRHKLNNLQDLVSSFFIIKLLQGARKKRPQVDGRLPITKPVLHRLVLALNNTCGNPYYRSAYKAMFLIAFYGFLRIGEITKNINANSSHCLNRVDVQVTSGGVIITCHSYKHSIPGSISKIFIKREVELTFCPVVHLERYLTQRGNGEGYFFMHPNLSPISRAQFVASLNAALSFIGLRPSVCKGHSFRIGAPTLAYHLGKSDTQIRALGRWKSNAFLKY